MKTLKRLWTAWKSIAHVIGDFQARVLLSLFYFVVLGPFALGLKMFSDPLGLRRTSSVRWLVRDEGATTAGRQF